MEWLSSNETIEILIFLLPGFVAVIVFYSFTSHPKPNIFEQIIQSLIFTITVSTILWFFKSQIASWNENITLILSIAIAGLLGILAVYLINEDILHRILRKFKVTKETSYPSEWYSAFSRLSDCYVVLHFTGGRRLYGWPSEWPSSPNEGHFFIQDGEWLLEENERKPITGVVAILVPVLEVEMVEFLPQVSAKGQRND